MFRLIFMTKKFQFRVIIEIDTKDKTSLMIPMYISLEIMKNLMEEKFQNAIRLFYYFPILFYFRTELLDELGSLSFSIFDGASVSEWKGKDLRLADNIPNIDLLVLSIEQVRIY